jgi:hypothetical protein
VMRTPIRETVRAGASPTSPAPTMEGAEVQGAVLAIQGLRDMTAA